MAIQATCTDGMGAITITGSTATTTGMKAVDLTSISEDYVAQGGVVGISTDCAVTQNGTPNKSVNIAAGTGYILRSTYTRNNNTTQKYIRFINDATVNTTIPDNTSGNPRIDLICAKFDPAVTPNDNADNVITIVQVQGTPAGSPSAPAVPANHLVLAQIAVANGFTSIVTANITDRRVFANLNLILPNNTAITAYDSTNTARNLMKLGTSNILEIGGTGITGTYHVKPINCMAKAAGSQTTGDSVFTTAQLATMVNNASGLFSLNGSNAIVYNGPSGALARVSGAVGFTAWSGTSRLLVSILKNGTAIDSLEALDMAAQSSNEPTFPIAGGETLLNNGDTLTLSIFQATGSTRTIDATTRLYVSIY